MFNNNVFNSFIYNISHEYYKDNISLEYYKYNT